MVHQVPGEAGGAESRAQVELASDGGKDTYSTVPGGEEEETGANRSGERSVFGGLPLVSGETVSSAAVKGSVFEERSDISS